MEFKPSLPFKKWCKSGNFSKSIREDSEIEIEITKKNLELSPWKIGDKVESPIFPCNSDANFKWKLEFYPLDGDGSYEESSIFLRLAWRKFKVPAFVVMSFEFKTKRRLISTIHGLEHTYEKPGIWGQSHLKVFQEIKSRPIRETLGYSYMSVCAQVSAYYDVYSCHNNSVVSEGKLLNNFSSFLESGLGSDVVICTNEAKFKVHRSVLISRSDVFAAMLSNNMHERLTGEIVINDISDITMKQMLKFIYYCDVDFKDAATTLDLLIASDKYNLSDLTLQCEEYLTAIVDESNSASILISADFYNLVDLKNTVLEYICKNKDKFLNGFQYKILSKENPDLLIEIIKQLSA